MKRFGLILTTILTIMTATSCADKDNGAQNPFFEEWTTPFGVPPFDRIDASHFVPAFDRAMSVHLAEIDAITNNADEPTFENTVEAFDSAGEMLGNVALVFEMLSDSDLTPEMQQVAEHIMPILSAHSDAIMLNDKLFDRIREIYERRESLGLDDIQIRLVEKIYRNFVNSGAQLGPEQKEQLKKINEELAVTSVAYGNNLLAATNAFQLEITEAADLDGLPTSVRDAARETATAAGKSSSWIFTLHKPSLILFLTYSTKRDLRRQLYTAYLERGAAGTEYDNTKLINDFIRLRTEKARLLGFESYAHYVTSEQMAERPEAVYKLLNSIWEPALERAKGELADMEKLLHRDDANATFESWDWWYYAEKVRKQNYSLDEEMLRPYFSLDNVQNGIFTLANSLYGISFRPVKVPLYNDEAMAYEVLDTDQSHLGVLYFDFFPRDTKGGGAWCGYFREQSYKDGKRVAPVVGIVCNFTRPTKNTPALLSVDEVETLFHEFGHALHFLFHDVRYSGLSEVEGDFVELPSQIMENWALEPEMLAKYATHYRTKEVIPSTLVNKLLRSKHFNQGFMTTELVAAALSDMDIHSTTEYKPFDVREYEKSVLNDKRGLIPQIEPRYRYPYFSHIFDGGYSAGYYFYLWAEVLDKDAFQAFKESGYLFDRETAARFRKLLASGGSVDGGTLYRNFRGKNPDQRAMLEARGLAPEEPAAPANE